MKVTRITAMELPNGTRIDIDSQEGKYIAEGDERKWETLRIAHTGQFTAGEVLCEIDFDGDSTMDVSFYSYGGELIKKLKINVGTKNGGKVSE